VKRKLQVETMSDDAKRRFTLCARLDAFDGAESAAALVDALDLASLTDDEYRALLRDALSGDSYLATQALLRGSKRGVLDLYPLDGDDASGASAIVHAAAYNCANALRAMLEVLSPDDIRVADLQTDDAYHDKMDAADTFGSRNQLVGARPADDDLRHTLLAVAAHNYAAESVAVLLEKDLYSSRVAENVLTSVLFASLPSLVDGDHLTQGLARRTLHAFGSRGVLPNVADATKPPEDTDGSMCCPHEIQINNDNFASMHDILWYISMYPPTDSEAIKALMQALFTSMKDYKDRETCPLGIALAPGIGGCSAVDDSLSDYESWWTSPVEGRYARDLDLMLNRLYPWMTQDAVCSFLRSEDADWNAHVVMHLRAIATRLSMYCKREQRIRDTDTASEDESIRYRASKEYLRAYALFMACKALGFVYDMLVLVDANFAISGPWTAFANVWCTDGTRFVEQLPFPACELPFLTTDTGCDEEEKNEDVFISMDQVDVDVRAVSNAKVHVTPADRARCVVHGTILDMDCTERQACPACASTVFLAHGSKSEVRDDWESARLLMRKEPSDDGDEADDLVKHMKAFRGPVAVALDTNDQNTIISAIQHASAKSDMWTKRFSPFHAADAPSRTQLMQLILGLAEPERIVASDRVKTPCREDMYKLLDELRGVTPLLASHFSTVISAWSSSHGHEGCLAPTPLDAAWARRLLDVGAHEPGTGPWTVERDVYANKLAKSLLDVFGIRSAIATGSPSPLSVRALEAIRVQYRFAILRHKAEKGEAVHPFARMVRVLCHDK